MTTNRPTCECGAIPVLIIRSTDNRPGREGILLDEKAYCRDCLRHYSVRIPIEDLGLVVGGILDPARRHEQ